MRQDMVTRDHPSVRVVLLATLRGLVVGGAIFAVVLIAVLLAGMPGDQLERVVLALLVTVLLSTCVSIYVDLAKYMAGVWSELGFDDRVVEDRVDVREYEHKANGAAGIERKALEGEVLDAIKSTMWQMVLVREGGQNPSRSYMTESFGWVTQPLWNSARALFTAMGWANGNDYTFPTRGEAGRVLGGIDFVDENTNRVMVPVGRGYRMLQFSSVSEYGNSHIAPPQDGMIG